MVLFFLLCKPYAIFKPCLIIRYFNGILFCWILFENRLYLELLAVNVFICDIISPVCCPATKLFFLGNNLATKIGMKKEIGQQIKENICS